jgi:hypothetical protein
LEALRRVQSIPIAALIWGPTPKVRTPVARARIALKNALLTRGHLARFSEEMVDRRSKTSTFLQQVAQVEAFDIVFSIPDSAGSIAEIHDFSRIPQIAHKIVAFLNRSWNAGYSNQSLIQLQSPITCQIRQYSEKNLPHCIVQDALEMVGRLQEVHYTAGRRRI